MLFRSGGGGVSKNGTVFVTISKGQERIKVPELLGLTLDAATAALAKLNLKVGSTTKAFSPNVDLDLIISSNPPAGSDAKKDSLISLTVSKGIQQISLTSFVGMTSDQALNDLTELGAEVVTKYAYSDSVQVGYVISQSPDGSSPVAKGTKVTLVVSKGPSSVIVPNVKSLSKDQAITILENLGLKIGRAHV